MNTRVEARQGGPTTVRIQKPPWIHIMNIENDPFEQGPPRRAHHNQTQTAAWIHIMNIENDAFEQGPPRRAHHSQGTDSSVNQSY